MEYVKPFVIGGGLIALGKYTSKFVNPAIAPLIGGLPTGVIASFFLDNDKMRKGYYNGYVYSSFVLFFVITAIHLAGEHTAMSMDLISLVGLAIWGAISYVVINAEVISKGRKGKGRSKGRARTRGGGGGARHLYNEDPSAEMWARVVPRGTSQ
tara:strand:- start:453 stop:914 length:462 start_codon:yes stop_codon:yes gene_type:complete